MQLLSIPQHIKLQKEHDNFKKVIKKFENVPYDYVSDPVLLTNLPKLCHLKCKFMPVQ